MGVKFIIWQNKKGAHQELFFKSELTPSIDRSDLKKDLEKKIPILQNQLNSLPQRLLVLETTIQSTTYAHRTEKNL